MKAIIKGIEYSLPDNMLTNDMLAHDFPDWSVDKISSKTGINIRHVVSEDQTASDIGAQAANKLFDAGLSQPEEIDYLLYCTQSPDYFLPTTACILQDKLGIPKNAGALDFNLGCSGYVYGLGLAKGLIETEQAQNVLLITAETYSKFINPGDKSVRTLFGDAAAATIVKGEDIEQTQIGPFVYGTDGSGAKNLIVPCGGLRNPSNSKTSIVKKDKDGNLRSEENLYMNGSEVFAFTLRSVPKAVNDLLEKTSRNLDDIDLFVFHQANQFMLNQLRKKVKIPEDKFVCEFEDVGNTVSSTIPIALKKAEAKGKLKKGMDVMLVGFGVGYSWGATLIKW